MAKKKLKKETLVIKIKIPKPRLPKGMYTRICEGKREKIVDKIHEKEIQEARCKE